MNPLCRREAPTDGEPGPFPGLGSWPVPPGLYRLHQFLAEATTHWQDQGPIAGQSIVRQTTSRHSLQNLRHDELPWAGHLRPYWSPGTGTYQILSNTFQSCRALRWETLSKSTPRFLSCVSNSVVNTTAAMSPVGIRYNSRPWANFRSQWLLACWYSKAATGNDSGSQSSMSSFCVKADWRMVQGKVKPLIFWLLPASWSWDRSHTPWVHHWPHVHGLETLSSVVGKVKLMEWEVSMVALEDRMVSVDTVG